MQKELSRRSTPQTDVRVSLHEIAKSQVQKWRAVARIAAGNKDDADEIVAKFLENLIAIAGTHAGELRRPDVSRMFLTLVRASFSDRVSPIALDGENLSQLISYDQFETEALSYLMR